MSNLSLCVLTSEDRCLASLALQEVDCARGDGVTTVLTQLREGLLPKLVKQRWRSLHQLIHTPLSEVLEERLSDLLSLGPEIAEEPMPTQHVMLQLRWTHPQGHAGPRTVCALQAVHLRAGKVQDMVARKLAVGQPHRPTIQKSSSLPLSELKAVRMVSDHCCNCCVWRELSV